VAADKAYSSKANRTYLRRRGIKAVIPEKADPAASRKKRGRAGGRPIAHDTNCTRTATRWSAASARSRDGAGWPLPAEPVADAHRKRPALPNDPARACRATAPARRQFCPGLTGMTPVRHASAWTMTRPRPRSAASSAGGMQGLAGSGSKTSMLIRLCSSRSVGRCIRCGRFSPSVQRRRSSVVTRGPAGG
jgi:hypothetical protein